MPRFTQQEYTAYLARQSQPVAAIAGVDKESDLHVEILNECKRRGWIAFHGSMATATFRTPGEPDFVILASECRLFLVECKTKTGKLSTDQVAIHAWASQLGHKVHVVRSIQEFLEII